jgi:hypothetical protein
MKLSRLLLVFSLFAFLLFSSPTIVFGQFEGASAGVSKWATPIEQVQQVRDESDGFNLEKFSHTTLLYGLYGLEEGILGTVKGNKQSGKTSTGAINIVGNYISQIVAQPPISSVEYIADLGHQINPIKSAYAQDSTGYQGLSGVLDIWKGFRNIAYALFVIIFVVVGFMIMFRTKLNPQTVVSLQLALPKLIITLLLITFSYAISGFIIDLIYFTIYLAVNLFSTIGVSQYTNAEVFLDKPFVEILRLFDPNSIATSFSNSLSALFPGEAIGNVLKGSIIGITLVKLIVGGAILFSILKLLVQLIIAYVNIILQVIFAPIILLFNALPQSNAFSSWIKNLVANAAAFPATAVMILVGSSLAASPDISSKFTPPFLGSLDQITDFSKDVIGLGTILLLPKIVSMIQEALKAKSAMPVGPAIAEGVSAAAALPTSFFRSRREAQLKRQESQYQAQRTGEELRKVIP